MTRAEFKETLGLLADAWTQRNYAAATDAFAEDIRYADPLRYSFHGRAQLRAFFEADEGCSQRCVWHTIIFDEDQQIGAAEYTYDGTHRYHGIALIRIEDGRITHWREHQHVDARDWEEFASGTLF